MVKPYYPHLPVTAVSRRYLPVLLALFVGSGCSALIYEIVWFQLLELIIGSSAVSLGVLLGTFMGGMCLGSFGFARFVSPRRHPLRVYAAIEASIGVLALAVLVGLPYAGGLYTAIAGRGMTGVALRGALCAVCLLAPTVLMGATLPAIARWIGASTPDRVSWLGFFYGGNIAGAVFGCLLAGFYLLRVHDMATATYVAVFINAGVAAVAMDLADRTPAVPEGPGVQADAALARESASPRLVHAAIALSGLAALGAEVVWTRLLSLMLGATVYAFSIILAVFLIGLGLGSAIGSWLSRTIARPRAALGWTEMLLAPSIAWTAYALARLMPYWPLDSALASDPWYVFRVDLSRSLLALLPATLCWGASFPLALGAVGDGAADPGRLVGRLYAANTLGAIAGAIGFSTLVDSARRHRARAADPHRALGRRVAAPDRARAPDAVRRRSPRRDGRGDLPGADRARRAADARRLRPIDADQRVAAHPLRRRGHERVSGGVRARQRRAQLPRQRQGGSLDRSAGHAAAADARQPAGAGSSSSAIGARRRLRRGRDGRLVRAVPGHPARRDLRDRAAHSAPRGAASSRARTTASSATRASSWSSTTRGTTC